MIQACQCQCCQKHRGISLLDILTLNAPRTEKTAEQLAAELAQSEQNVADFERLAHSWKKAYEDQEMKYKKRVGDLEATIEELEKEIIDLGKI